MSIIILKNRQEIEVSAQSANEIKRLWSGYYDDKKNIQIEIGNISTMISEIKMIDISAGSEIKKEQNKEYLQDVEKEYLAMRKEKLLQTPEVRAKNLNIFKLLYWAATGRGHPAEEMIVNVIEIQKKFFAENLKRIYPDPMLFKEMLSGLETNSYSRNKDFISTEVLVRDAAMRVVEIQVGTDMRYASGKF